jgi:hypothetical protein
MNSTDESFSVSDTKFAIQVPWEVPPGSATAVAVFNPKFHFASETISLI